VRYHGKIFLKQIVKPLLSRLSTNNFKADLRLERMLAYFY